ncbi:tripartite tricarboxylate transporter substrate binding protein [Mycobacterium sp. ITM-2016-00316]|uniref:tripartite tricarboxylate transporter substrate binding protein n=1 Tax=Mycobacterium sp. ITM-2016-00316 TaxID=2099695 RepID=UPI000CF923EF|nr:tripartite tricarboxylate transporter substrate binding protein [Mycobacterium sp. ITM-2016-00316]WNG82240.1 tripartite tricarboxylate transporter substrate binding protein [Mycobacterium sp. ITM-2016-00316]
MAIATARLRSAVAPALAAIMVTACSSAIEPQGADDGGGTWPSGTVDMYVGYAAGGSSDLISRAVADGLSGAGATPFRIINREGGNGAIAAAEVAAAPADGSVIAIQNGSLYTITPLAVAPDEAADIGRFDVVYGISRDHYVVVANPASGFRAIQDILRANHAVRYGTTGVGTGAQLSAALLFKNAEVPALPVPFDSGAPALAAVLAGEVDIAVIHVGEAIESIRSERLVPLAVFGSDRNSYLPDVPTAQEQGVDAEVTQYRFMTVRKGTPQYIKDALVEGLKATFDTGAYRNFNEQHSFTPMEIPGDEVLGQLAEDKQRYAQVVQQNGIDLHDGG